MNVFISADIEGISGVVHREHTARDGREHDRARTWMTNEVNAAIEGAFDAGAKEVVVNDSHGTMRNLIPEQLNKKAELILGSPKPLAMMQGIDASFDVVLFIGYHTRMGTRGILNHTFHGGVVQNIRVNGIDMGEFGLNALVAGAFGVPVVLASGCNYLADEALDLIPEIETAIVKKTVNRYTARNLSPDQAASVIKEKTVMALKRRNEISPYHIKGPFEIELTYLNSGLADAADVLPIIERISPTIHRFSAKDPIEVYRYIRSLIKLADI